MIISMVKRLSLCIVLMSMLMAGSVCAQCECEGTLSTLIIGPDANTNSPTYKEDAQSQAHVDRIRGKIVSCREKVKCATCSCTVEAKLELSRALWEEAHVTRCAATVHEAQRLEQDAIAEGKKLLTEDASSETTKETLWLLYAHLTRDGRNPGAAVELLQLAHDRIENYVSSSQSPDYDRLFLKTSLAFCHNMSGHPELAEPLWKEISATEPQNGTEKNLGTRLVGSARHNITDSSQPHLCAKAE